MIIVNGLPKCKLKVGDIVTTTYIKGERYVERLVVKVIPYNGHSQTGWKVTTSCSSSLKKYLSVDADWYTLVEKMETFNLDDF